MKRTLQVSVVKKPKNAVDEPEDETEVHETVLVASAAIENVVRQIGYAVAGYVVLDTLRQVIVASATNK